MYLKISIANWRPYCLGFNVLTHWSRVMHICVNKLTITGSDNGLSPGRRQSHYLNQCWNTVNWTLRNKFQWNLNQNLYIFIQENAFGNVVWKTAAILSWPQCVYFDLQHLCCLIHPQFHFALPLTNFHPVGGSKSTNRDLYGVVRPHNSASFNGALTTQLWNKRMQFQYMHAMLGVEFFTTFVILLTW